MNILFGKTMEMHTATQLKSLDSPVVVHQTGIKRKTEDAHESKERKHDGVRRGGPGRKPRACKYTNLAN
jgi:hypothetical protein